MQSRPFRHVSKSAAIFAFTLLSLSSAPLVAQIDPNIDNSIREYGSYDGSEIDTVSLHNGGLSIHIPIFEYPQRGDVKTTVVLMLGSKIWHNWETDCKFANPPGCTGKWHIGAQSHVLETEQDKHFGIYLTIDDNMPRLTGQSLSYSGSSGGGTFNWPTDNTQNDDVDRDTAVAPPSGGSGGSGGPGGDSGDSLPLAVVEASGTASQTWQTYEVWLPNGATHWLWGQSASTQVAIDGSGFVCQGCSYGPNNTSGWQYLARRDGAQANPAGQLMDRNGNVVDPGGVDTMGRQLYAVLNNGGATTQEGCLPTDTSAKLYSFPGIGAGPSDTSRLIKLCSHTESLNTAFSSDPNIPMGFTDSTGNGEVVQESSFTEDVVTRVIVYDGNAWTSSPAYTFQYNNGQTGPDASGANVVDYGDLTKLTLPSGGSISYTWNNIGSCNGITLTPASRSILTRTIDPNVGDPSQIQVNTYSPGESGALVTDKEGNTVTHYFTYPIGNPGACSSESVETKTVWMDSAQHTLKQVDTEYAAQTGPDFLSFMPVGVRKTAETTTFDNGTKLRVEYDFDTALSLPAAPGFGYSVSGLSYGTLTQKREYDFNQASGGNVLRCTQYAYRAIDGTASNPYLAANILDLPTSESVYSGLCAGTPLKNTTFGYDENLALQPSGAGQLNLAVSATRGNQTSVHKSQLNPIGLPISTGVKYYDSGQPYQATDALNNTTTFAFDNADAGAYLTQTQMPTTNGIAHIVSAQYDYNTGSVTSYTDQNNQTSNYSYDPLGRIWTAHYPDAGSSSVSLSKAFCYPDLKTVTEITAQSQPLTAPGSSMSCPSIANSKSLTRSFDGLGRISKTVLIDGVSTSITTDTSYDDLGRVRSVSNPYHSVSDGTFGLTTYSYDALNRRIVQSQPDRTSFLYWCYDGVGLLGASPCPQNQSAVTGLSNTSVDESGLISQNVTNALGHLSSVMEEAPSGGSLTLETDYVYDVLDNLKSVNQIGAGEAPRARSFSYDSISRLLTATNPEIGTICYGIWSSGSCVYGYDANGNLKYKTDARGITTSYSYDALNRLLTTTYTNDTSGTPSSCYIYDNATAGSNGNGRLATQWTQSGVCSSAPPSNPKSLHAMLAYDALGRLLQDKRCTGVNYCTAQTYRPMTYRYDLAGNPTASSDGYGNRAFFTQYDGSGRLLNFVGGVPNSSSSGIAPLFSIQNYGPLGWTGASIGSNLSAQRSYDNRMRLSGEAVVIP